MTKNDGWNLRDKAERVKHFIWRKQRLRTAYRDCFCGRDGKPHPAGQIVLAHLGRLSREHGSIAVVGQNGQLDPYASMLAEGQRVLYQTIVMHLNLNDSDLYDYERAERAAQPKE